MKLNLLFTQNGLQYQLSNAKNITEEKIFFPESPAEEDFCIQELEQLLTRPGISEIVVVSAINHFTMMPAGFQNHDLCYDLISYNAPVNRDLEELMLSVNKKFGIQFYYTLPKNIYQKIKSAAAPSNFNFSGEKFLNSVAPKGGKEIHINLYHHQCEFFALDNKRLLLYNNLDVNSEVDFLYFIMFTLSKLGFSTTETQFFVYGETTENETFIFELRKFVKQMKIVFDNLHGRNFILK